MPQKVKLFSENGKKVLAFSKKMVRMKLATSTKDTTKKRGEVSKMSNNIKLERARFDLSRKELAEALGVSEKSVQNWENDIGTCSVRQLMAMSNIFKCSADYLTGRTEAREIL